MLQELDANIGGPIENKIYTIRGTQVMLDFELAMIYGYSTKAFNQQIKNNKERFDDDFMFQLTDNEAKFLRSKILTTNFSPKSRSLPYVVSIKQHQIKADERIDELFSLMDKYNIEDKQGIFFQGQIFDAYAKFESFILSATKDIILIDGYVDLTVLDAAIIPAILQNL